jgi:ketosteroid isomerase-like protein
MVEPTYLSAKQAARANRAFYDAFQARDLSAMRDLWLDDPGVKCIHPGSEVLCGLEAILASWRCIFDGTERIEFEVMDPSIDVMGELAWITLVERVRSTSHGETFIAEAAATNLFALRDGEWRMVLHHASPIARRFRRA